MLFEFNIKESFYSVHGINQYLQWIGSTSIFSKFVIFNFIFNLFLLWCLLLETLLITLSNCLGTERTFKKRECTHIWHQYCSAYFVPITLHCFLINKLCQKLANNNSHISFFLYPYTADGLDAPSGNCTAGWYCTGGSYMAEPVTTDNATDLSECTCPLVNYTGKWSRVYVAETALFMKNFIMSEIVCWVPV